MTETTAIAAAEPKPPVRAGGEIAALVPGTLDEAFRLAQALSRAGDMVPQHFQGKPEATMAAIVRGMEVGLSPMQALNSIAVINGRATIWGDAIPALLQRAGHHVDVELEGEGEATVAVATLTRGDSGRKTVRRFSVADAKRAGLWMKKTSTGKDTPWVLYPDRMLAMRARTWAARDGAADALMGLSVTEEVEDHGPDQARDVTPAAPPRGGVVYREPEPEPEPEPEVDELLEGEVVVDEQPTGEEEPPQ